MTELLDSVSTAATSIAKSPTGILGLDEITFGGFPTGRPTLICGNAGCGKTLMAMQFLINGAERFGEPGVFMAFEETTRDLTENVRSLGVDLDDMVRDGRISLDHVAIERSEIEETGEYDLEALFLRLGYAIDSIGAKRVVLDTLEALFGGLSNEGVLRAELRRLFHWLKKRGVTAVITAERGEGQLTRHGLEEYVSDCVILLDHRISDQVATRRLRIVKYRGTRHGTNEYPFLIDERGIDVLPVTSVGLDHEASSERVPSGIAELDDMLAGGGYYRGSSVMVTGTAGSGKSSLAAHFANAACRRGERCLYFAFEESPRQIMRNMRSIGIDLEPHLQANLLQFHCSRPTLTGLESHLAHMHKAVRRFDPAIVVVDPITNFVAVGTQEEVKDMLVRLVDYLKANLITTLYTSLTHDGSPIEQTDIGLSSLIDTWLLLRDVEVAGERNRAMYLLKSRGMAHSNQVREFLLTDQGVRIVTPYLGPEGMFTGSARLAQEAREAADAQRIQGEIERHAREMQRRREAFESRMRAMQLEFESEMEELSRTIGEVRGRQEQMLKDRLAIAESRGAEANGRSQHSMGSEDPS